jgi:hypothetical protein
VQRRCPKPITRVFSKLFWIRPGDFRSESLKTDRICRFIIFTTFHTLLK